MFRPRTQFCRHCLGLFRQDAIGVQCLSAPCSQVRDEHGHLRPRYWRASDYRMWKRWSRRLDLSRPCPFCREVERLHPACPHCRGRLEQDEGVDRVLAVVGASQSGKSHYLAAVLHQLLDGNIGGESWQVSVEPEDERRLRREFLDPLFEDQQELQKTPAEVGPELRLTLEHRQDGRRALLIFRDLGGEIFLDEEAMERASYLRYAQGVVLMADPLAFPPPGSEGGAVPWQTIDQSDALEVLKLYRQLLERQPRHQEFEALPLLPQQKHLAVVVTKADLVLPPEDEFWGESTSAENPLEMGFWERREPLSERIRQWVYQHLSRDLARLDATFADVGYFFASSYGYSHPPGSALVGPPEPRRVHEPIFALLDRLGLETAALPRRPEPATVGSSTSAGGRSLSTDEDLF